MTEPFGARLRDAVAQAGPLSVGIDPHAHLLREWELPDSAAGARELGLRVVDAAAGRAAAVKPQVAFFERFGSAGVAALEEVLAAARAADILSIADAKRGDIGSTMAAYAEAWLRPGSPLESDAVTVSPYLGVGALDGAVEEALAHGKGLFVLAATSNPEAAELQRAERGEETVAALVADAVAVVNARTSAPGEWGSIGLVIGATVDLEAIGLSGAVDPASPILAPGFGAQGATLRDLPAIFGPLAPFVLAHESRGILGGGPGELVARIEARRAELAARHE